MPSLASLSEKNVTGLVIDNQVIARDVHRGVSLHRQHLEAA